MGRNLMPLLFAVLCACGAVSEKEAAAPTSSSPLIVCTTGMLADAIMNLGTGCEVHALMGPGTDPHLFKPTKQSLDLLQSADLIVANGLHLEGRMQDILEKMARQKPVFFATDGLGTDTLLYEDVKGTVPDPHIWMDVALWRDAVKHLSNELRRVKPLCYDSASSAGYLDSLSALHAWVGQRMALIPDTQRVLITAHDAFSYFGRAYDVEVVALQGISTAAEYGVRDVTNMIDLITRRGIKAIFEESSIAPRSIEAVVAGCAKKGFVVQRGGTLYSDALGGAGSGAETYLDMVRHNVNLISNSLQ